MSKLNKDDIYIIRKKKALGCRNTALMKMYNLSYAELRQILDDAILNKGDTYGH